jgi:uncharacterized protein YbdZ (MbtH family)
MFRITKIASVLILSIFTCLMLSSNATMGRPQRGYQVSIYSDANYRGAVQMLDEGWYNIEKLRIGNDTLSSLRVPAGWRVTLFEHGDFKGRSMTLRSDCSYVGNDFNNQTSSIRVERGNSMPPVHPPVYPPAPAPNKHQVSIYSDANYRGAVQMLEKGWYNVDKLRIGNDVLSSLRVPAGWRVTLFEHRDFKGRSKVLRSDCSYIGDDFNDLTSSIRVEFIGIKFGHK